MNPTLAPPGAGVPAYQRLTGKYVLLPYYCRTLSWSKAPELLQREAQALLALSTGRTTAALERRVLVTPTIGLEDSSRYWSYAMLLEHLRIIGQQTTGIIVALTHGRDPGVVIRTEDLKPAPGAHAADAIAGLGDFLEAFRQRIPRELGDRRSTMRAPHPWFGPLDAYQWLCFLPFHQRIHVVQARKIFSRV